MRKEDAMIVSDVVTRMCDSRQDLCWHCLGIHSHHHSHTHRSRQILGQSQMERNTSTRHVDRSEIFCKVSCIIYLEKFHLDSEAVE